MRRFTVNTREQEAAIEERTAAFREMIDEGVEEVRVAAKRITDEKDKTIAAIEEERDKQLEALRKQTIGRAEQEVSAARARIESEVTDLRNRAERYAKDQIDGYVSSLENQAQSMALRATGALRQQAIGVVQNAVSEVLEKFSTGGALFYPGHPLFGALESAKAFAAGFAQALPFVAVAFLFVQTLLKGIFGRSRTPNLFYTQVWNHQHTAWLRLYEAAGGERLPFYDRFFRLRLAVDGGFALGTLRGQKHWYTITQYPYLLIQHMTVPQQELFGRIFTEMEWPLPQQPGFYLGMSNESKARTWREVTDRQMTPGATNTILKRGNTHYAQRVEQNEARRYQRTFTHGAVTVDERGWPQIAPDGATWPEIPASRIRQIPLPYLLTWLAPPRADFTQALAAFERIRYEMRAQFSTPDWEPPPPGRDLLIPNGAWGQLAQVDATDIMLETDWVEKELLNLKRTPDPRSTVDKVSAKNDAPLSLQSYKEIIDFITVDRSSGNIAKQRSVEARRPLVQEAIAWASAIRAGSSRARLAANELTQRVNQGTATLEDQTRLSLLSTGLLGLG